MWYSEKFKITSKFLISKLVIVKVSKHILSNSIQLLNCVFLEDKQWIFKKNIIHISLVCLLEVCCPVTSIY